MKKECYIILIKIYNIRRIKIISLLLIILLFLSTNSIAMIELNNNSKNFIISSSFLATLSYRPKFYDFGEKYKGEIDNTTLEIWNSGCCYLEYSIIEDCNWINVYPNNGTSRGEHHNITIEINTNNMTLGNHSYNISIISNVNNGYFNVYLRIIEEPNNPPEKPIKPTGPTSGKPYNEYNFSTSTIDIDNDQIFYMWDWGNGATSVWLGPYNSGEECKVSNIWYDRGTYNIKVKAKDILGLESEWSDLFIISMPLLNYFNYKYYKSFWNVLEFIFNN